MRFRIFFILCILTSMGYANPVGFESPEHMLIGDDIVLPLSLISPTTNVTQLTLINGLVLSYGEIVTLSGDYYGVPESPISLGVTLEDKQARFMKAFESLANDTSAKVEAEKILEDIQLEISELKIGMEKGETPSQVYDRVNMDHIVSVNCITGGFCAADHPGLPKDVIYKIFVLNQGRTLKLAQTDFDHFAEYAWSSYSTGHTLALNMARKAYIAHDANLLIQAYALNGFASHFLSDLFASGHMRTPHYDLAKNVFPATIGSLLASRMHNEDNLQGLAVQNIAGDHWVAYGDTLYLDARNKQNRDLLRKAMQASVDEIFATFQTGQYPTTDTVLPFIPDLSELHKNVAHINSAPLFFWDADKKQLLRRNHVKDKFDYEQTAVWVGWETLLELSTLKNLSVFEQAALLKHDDTRMMALRLGLIKDKELMEYQ